MQDNLPRIRLDGELETIKQWTISSINPQTSILVTSPSIGLDGGAGDNKIVCCEAALIPRLAFWSPPLALDWMGSRRQ